MLEHLNCDAPGCGHVEQVSEITEAHVGMACPVCGANLLTREDWEGWQPIRAAMRAAEALSARLGLDQAGVCGEAVETRVRLHGGKTTIEIDRQPKPPGEMH